MAWQPTMHSGQEIQVVEREELKHLRRMVEYLTASRDEAKLELAAAKADLAEARKDKSYQRCKNRVLSNKLNVLCAEIKKLKNAKPTTFFGREIKATDRKTPKKK